MKKPKMKIITHDGIFHADEVFAVALLNIFLVDSMSIPVTRTRNPKLIEQAIDDPNTFVLDVGGIFDQDRLAFDHHQVLSMKPTNILILNWLFYNNPSDELKMVYPFLLMFMKGIAEWDINKNQSIINMRNIIPIPAKCTFYSAH